MDSSSEGRPGDSPFQIKGNIRAMAYKRAAVLMKCDGAQGLAEVPSPQGSKAPSSQRVATVSFYNNAVNITRERGLARLPTACLAETYFFGSAADGYQANK